MKQWYLIYSKPRREELARVNLERQGFTAYLPWVRQVRHRLGRSITRVEPLFPRYLFLHLDAVNDNWAPIRSTLGVSSLIRFGEEPAAVPAELVEAIRVRDDAAGVQDLPLMDFQRGDSVRIADGPMMGYEGIFLARTSRERVLILLNIVGRQRRVRVEGRRVERA